LTVVFSHVGMGRDGTLFALSDGHVHFTYLPLRFHRRKRERKFVHVLAAGESIEQLRAQTEEKGKQLEQLVQMHRKGIWLPSPKQIKAREEARQANADKIAAQKQALQQAIAEDSTAFADHPLMKMRAQAAQ